MKNLESENKFLIFTVKKMIELVYKLCTKNKEKVNRIAEMEKEIETLKEDIKELKLSFDKTSETKENLTEKMERTEAEGVKQNEALLGTRLVEGEKERQMDLDNCVIRAKFDELLTFTEKLKQKKTKAYAQIKAQQQEIEQLKQQVMSISTRKGSPSAKAHEPPMHLSTATRDMALNTQCITPLKNPSNVCKKCRKEFDNHHTYLDHCLRC